MRPVLSNSDVASGLEYKASCITPMVYVSWDNCKTYMSKLCIGSDFNILGPGARKRE